MEGEKVDDKKMSEKEPLHRKSSPDNRKLSQDAVSTSSLHGSPRQHHRSPGPSRPRMTRSMSERRKPRHHHHHNLERKGSLMVHGSSHSSHHAPRSPQPSLRSHPASLHLHGPEGRRTSRVGDRRQSHAVDQNQNASRASSISELRRKGSESEQIKTPERVPSVRKKQDDGPYMSPGLNMAGSYKTPGAEIIIATLIIGVGLVSLIVSFATGKRVWLIIGGVGTAIGGMFMILGICWCCAKAEDKDSEETSELRVVTHEEIRAKLMERSHSHRHGSVKNGKGPSNV